METRFKGGFGTQRWQLRSSLFAERRTRRGSAEVVSQRRETHICISTSPTLPLWHNPPLISSFSALTHYSMQSWAIFIKTNTQYHNSQRAGSLTIVSRSPHNYLAIISSCPAITQRLTPRPLNQGRSREGTSGRKKRASALLLENATSPIAVLVKRRHNGPELKMLLPMRIFNKQCKPMSRWTKHSLKIWNLCRTELIRQSCVCLFRRFQEIRNGISGNISTG